MPVPSHHTIGEIAATFGVPAWKARRAVDALGAEIPRAGRYRLVPRELLGRYALSGLMPHPAPSPPLSAPWRGER